MSPATISRMKSRRSDASPGVGAGEAGEVSAVTALRWYRPARQASRAPHRLAPVRRRPRFNTRSRCPCHRPGPSAEQRASHVEVRHMDIRRSTTILVLGLVLTGCGSAASVPPTASIAPSPAPTAAAVESVSPAESSSPVAAPTASPAADPIPAASVAAVPAKPTGVTFDRADSQTIEAAGGDTTMTVTWSGPRTEGVEIRVYGITECL